eukprot:3917603-Pyramimonas_sp.AAC.1
MSARAPRASRIVLGGEFNSPVSLTYPAYSLTRLPSLLTHSLTHSLTQLTHSLAYPAYSLTRLSSLLNHSHSRSLSVTLGHSRSLSVTQRLALLTVVAVRPPRALLHAVDGHRVHVRGVDARGGLRVHGDVHVRRRVHLRPPSLRPPHRL